MAEYKYRCVICPNVFRKDEMSFRDENEYDLDLCYTCLDGQREIDLQEERSVDFDWMRDQFMEIQEMQEKEQENER